MRGWYRGERAGHPSPPGGRDACRRGSLPRNWRGCPCCKEPRCRCAAAQSEGEEHGQPGEREDNPFREEDRKPQGGFQQRMGRQPAIDSSRFSGASHGCREEEWVKRTPTPLHSQLVRAHPINRCPGQSVSSQPRTCECLRISKSLLALFDGKVGEQSQLHQRGLAAFIIDLLRPQGGRRSLSRSDSPRRWSSTGPALPLSRQECCPPSSR